MSKKILFFGNERLATAVTTTAPVLRALAGAGYSIEAVIANHEDPISHQKRDLEIGLAAKSLGIPVILTGNAPLKEKVKNHPADLAVLVAFGKIIPQDVINMFPNGIINIHPSLLPKHRGPTPIESVILNGEEKTGVSIIKLSKEMDAGPVFGQAEVELKGTETKQELADKLIEIGAAMLIELLPGILEGSITAMPQDDSKATYDRLINKLDGKIDWSKPAAVLEREIRAYAGWPRSWATLGSQELIISSAEVSDQNAKLGEVITRGQEIYVGCGQKSLKITRVQPAGKKEMPVGAFLSGYKARLV